MQYPEAWKKPIGQIARSTSTGSDCQFLERNREDSCRTYGSTVELSPSETHHSIVARSAGHLVLRKGI